MHKTRLVVMAALVAAAALGFRVTVAAQAKTASAGIYTAAQAKAGAAVYNAKCAACHGPNLEGMGPMPPLSGPDFLATWGGESVGSLFGKTKDTMPATEPGSLSPDDAANVIAHILATNKFKAGTTALPNTEDALKGVSLGKP